MTDDIGQRLARDRVADLTHTEGKAIGSNGSLKLRYHSGRGKAAELDTQRRAERALAQFRRAQLAQPHAQLRVQRLDDGARFVACAVEREARGVEQLGVVVMQIARNARALGLDRAE